MGGLIGMALASQPGTPITRLVMNDSGPVITKSSLERIATYVGKVPEFPSLEAAEQFVRAIAAPFGPHSDAEWRFLTEVVMRENDDGGWRAHYDPKIGDTYRANMPEKDLELWPLWNAIRCPTLLLRGAKSDLLTRETAAQMAQTGPKAQVVEIPGVGHAPTLLHDEQIAIVREFLLA
jgi:pimeloyl-ACP methyl ester carboxylesterase